MEKSYYLNLAGVKISENDIQQISYPRLELGTHVTLKTTQAFGLLGGAIAAPISLAFKGQLDRDSLQNRSFQWGKNGILTGLVVGPVITALFCSGKSFDSLADRDYRLRLNKGQLRVDRFSILGLAAGVGVAHYLGEVIEKGAVFGYIGGFFLGTVVGQII